MTFIFIKILMWELSYCHSYCNYIVFLVESNQDGFSSSFLFICIVVGDPIIGRRDLCSHYQVQPRHILCLFQTWTCMPNVVCRCPVFIELIWEVIVRFVDIGKIDGHHCLNFHFIVTLKAHCTPWSPKVTNYCPYNEIMLIFS